MKMFSIPRSSPNNSASTGTSNDSLGRSVSVQPPTGSSDVAFKTDIGLHSTLPPDVAFFVVATSNPFHRLLSPAAGYMRSLWDIETKAHSHVYHAVYLFLSLRGESPENGSFLGYGWRFLGILGPKSSNAGLQRLLAMKKPA